MSQDPFHLPFSSPFDYALLVVLGPNVGIICILAALEPFMLEEQQPVTIEGRILKQLASFDSYSKGLGFR